MGHQSQPRRSGFANGNGDWWPLRPCITLVLRSEDLSASELGNLVRPQFKQFCLYCTPWHTEVFGDPLEDLLPMPNYVVSADGIRMKGRGGSVNAVPVDRLLTFPTSGQAWLSTPSSTPASSQGSSGSVGDRPCHFDRVSISIPRSICRLLHGRARLHRSPSQTT